MEDINRVIVSMIYFNSLVRDTLEYSIKKDVYDPKFYDYKRFGINNDINQNTPLKVFCERNGEKGAELLKNLQSFASDFYSDESTCVRKVQETVDGNTVDVIRVDDSFHVVVLTSTIPLYETLSNIIYLHQNEAEKEKKSDKRIIDLIDASDRYYRSVALLTLTGELSNQFEEFNKVMRENNGQKGPASNFIEGDLNKLAGLFNLVRSNARCKDRLYTNALDEVSKYIEMISGRRELPEGKKFADVVPLVMAEIHTFIQDAEVKWKNMYDPIIKEFVEDNKRLMAEDQANKA